jgi:hypothetical protein
MDLADLVRLTNRGMIAFDLARGTEVFTDVLWSASPALSRPGAKVGLRFAGAFNLGLAAGCAALALRRR